MHRKLKKKNRKIRKKVTSAIVLTLLLASMLTLTLSIQTTEGWTGKVFIRPDGSIDPPSAPISSSDKVTYTLVDSILGSITVLGDNIVLDGAGHTLQGTRVYGSRGIDLSGRTNVTVQNVHIKGFYYGIWLSESSGNTIIANDIIANDQDGVVLEHSSSNVVRENNITGNKQTNVELLSSDCNSIFGNIIADSWLGIMGKPSSNYNVISGNNITNNYIGVGFSDSSNYNCIYGNNITNASDLGIWFERSSGNRVYRNFFTYNDRQAYVKPGYANVWDNGFPSGGNYWSDYAGTDENKDGFGDTPYIIDAQNADHYPLTSSAPIVDVESPILSTTNPYHGEVIRSSAVTISWEAVDYASGINHYTVAIDDEYSINVGLNTSYTFTELDDGQHKVRIAAFDNAGNTVYRLLDFIIDDRISFAWPPYVAEALVTAAMVVALGITLYVLKSRYSFRIRKPSRKLIR